MLYLNIEADEFAQLMENDNVEIIDVRAPTEVAEGKIEGSKLINFFDSDFEDQLASLDKSKTYLLYCRSGNRSGQACHVMSAMGFKHLYNLIGGIGAWRTQTMA